MGARDLLSPDSLEAVVGLLEENVPALEVLPPRGVNSLPGKLCRILGASLGEHSHRVECLAYHAQSILGGGRAVGTVETCQKVLFVDAATGFYRMQRYRVGDFFGPVDLGLHLAGRLNSLNIGTGLLAGSIFPGSNRLVFTGFSPCWGGFFVSSMGGAALVFENLGINMVSIVGCARTPSVLVLNRQGSEEIEVELVPVDLPRVWREGRTGVYSLMDHVFERFSGRYQSAPRILATGPAALASDMGAICSVPVENGKLTFVDTWAGRGGFGTKLLKEHGIAAVIYGGSFVDEDFRDRRVADEWFQQRYQKKLAAKDFEATTKYRFDPKFDTGGTFGVNYATVGGAMLSFNSSSIYWDEAQRVDVHERLVLAHYLRQFNEETIKPKQQHTCGEPCAAVCKKMHGPFKKDYEPYQTMGPQCGIFDQRAAERLNHHADAYGFDAISVGGVLVVAARVPARGVADPRGAGSQGAARLHAGGLCRRGRLGAQRRAGVSAPGRDRGRERDIFGSSRGRGAGPATWPGRRVGRSWIASCSRPSRARAGWSRTSTGRRGRWRPCP